MAERRMFAKTIVTSDAFLDMPMSARCLYFTLGMFADDDGFVNNPKSIMRQVGATQDDMKILVEKRFLLVFESGVIVIKHWRINNYLRSDRYKETTYTDEKQMLTVEDNGAYTQNVGIPMLEDSGIPTVDQRDTQYSIDKDNKNSIDKNKKKKGDDLFSDVPDEIRDGFMEWVDMRKKIKKPITSRRAVTMALNKLDELASTPEQKLKLIDEAILHNWQSFYPPRTETRYESDKRPVERHSVLKEYKPSPADEIEGEEMPDEIRERIKEIFA